MVDEIFFCETCNKEYKNKIKHLDSKLHKRKVAINAKRNEYCERKDELLYKYINCSFEMFEKKSKLVNKQLKAEFGKNYRV